jgi:multisubunit Na+/H+ antiporter MnhB subunit
MALSEGISFLSHSTESLSHILVLLTLRVRAVWNWNRRVQTSLWIGYGFAMLGTFVLVALYLWFDAGRSLHLHPP